MTLRFENLRYTQGDFTLAVNLELQTPGRYCLLGASGTGKTTFLELIAGFLTPQQGRILFHGADWTAQSVEERAVSYLFQQENLFAHLSVDENLRLTGVSPAERVKALEAVGLTADMKTRLPRRLSGGQQQRVALARTLLLNRPVMLLDEPFSALDADTKTPIAKLARELQRTHGWLMVAVTHDPQDVERLEAKTLRIIDGEVRLCEEPPTS